MFQHRRPFWGVIYKALKMTDQGDAANYGKSVTQLGQEPVQNLKEAREQYVREQSKEILFEIS